MKQETLWTDLAEWVIHFRPTQIVFHSILSNLLPLVTERIAQLRLKSYDNPRQLFDKINFIMEKYRENAVGCQAQMQDHHENVSCVCSRYCCPYRSQHGPDPFHAAQDIQDTDTVFFTLNHDFPLGNQCSVNQYVQRVTGQIHKFHY